MSYLPHIYFSHSLVLKRVWQCSKRVPSSKQVWTGLQWWPPRMSLGGGRDPMSVGRARGRGSPYPMSARGLGPGWSPCLEGKGAVQLGPMHHGWWSHETCHVDRQTVQWKHYLPTTLLVGGKNWHLSAAPQKAKITKQITGFTAFFTSLAQFFQQDHGCRVRHSNLLYSLVPVDLSC